MSLLLAEPWVNNLVTALKNVIQPILILVAAAGIIYAVVVGIRFAKADDKSARDEAKAKLITVLVGIGVTLLLVALFYWLTWALENGIFSWAETLIPQGSESSANIGVNLVSKVFRR